MIDERTPEAISEFPLREIPLGMCICEHGNEDHATELTKYGVKDGMCELCICPKFRPKIKEETK